MDFALECNLIEAHKFDSILFWLVGWRQCRHPSPLPVGHWAECRNQLGCCYCWLYASEYARHFVHIIQECVGRIKTLIDNKNSENDASSFWIYIYKQQTVMVCIECPWPSYSFRSTNSIFVCWKNTNEHFMPIIEFQNWTMKNLYIFQFGKTKRWNVTFYFILCLCVCASC